MSCGKTRTIEREHGVFVFPDTNGLFLGEKPQHLYSVDPHDRGVYRPGRISTCTRSPTARGSSPASQYARVPIQSLVEVAKDIQPQDHDLIRYAPRFEPRDAGRPRGINSKKEILMKRVILATIATTAFLVPAVAQQSSQISPRHLSESEVRKIQQALDDRGFKSGKVDGSWGPGTEAAFKDFQKWATLSPTGEVDPISIAVLGLNVGDFELARARP